MKKIINKIHLRMLSKINENVVPMHNKVSSYFRNRVTSVQPVNSNFTILKLGENTYLINNVGEEYSIYFYPNSDDNLKDINADNLKTKGLTFISKVLKLNDVLDEIHLYHTKKSGLTPEEIKFFKPSNPTNVIPFKDFRTS